MGFYNVVNASSMAAGQPEDISQVLANFNAIAAVLNGGIDNTNISGVASIVRSKLDFGAGLVSGDLNLPKSNYVPTWTATGTAPSLGNGTLVGSYIKIGKFCLAEIDLTIGSTTTFGTGIWVLSLPFNASNAVSGFGQAFDTSTGNSYFAYAVFNTAADVTVKTPAQPATFYGSAIPFAWAVGDSLSLTLPYMTV